MPIKKVSIDGSLQGAFGILNIELLYKNESETSPLEATYEFPLEKETTVVSLIAKIGDKEIEAKV